MDDISGEYRKPQTRRDSPDQHRLLTQIERPSELCRVARPAEHGEQDPSQDLLGAIDAVSESDGNAKVAEHGQAEGNLDLPENAVQRRNRDKAGNPKGPTEREKGP